MLINIEDVRRFLDSLTDKPANLAEILARLAGYTGKKQITVKELDHAFFNDRALFDSYITWCLK